MAAIAALNIFRAGGITAGKNLGAVVQNCIMGFFGIRLAAFLAIRSTTDSVRRPPPKPTPFLVFVEIVPLVDSTIFG